MVLVVERRQGDITLIGCCVSSGPAMFLAITRYQKRGVLVCNAPVIADLRENIYINSNGMLRDSFVSSITLSVLACMVLERTIIQLPH